jgi:arylsulfatase A-like enzyme
MSVSFEKWLRESVANIREQPARGLLEAGFAAYLGLWHTLTTRLEPGMNVYEREWDMLIVLDACRVDALQAVASEYPFVNSVGSIQSVGSSSHEWMAHTFTSEYREEIHRTAYTSPNGFSELCFLDDEYPPRRTVPFGSFNWDVVDAADFALLDINWQRGQNPEFGIVPPRFMTDRAVHIGRETTFDRLVVHYYQPHVPYLARAVTEDRPTTPLESDPWAQLRQGGATREEAWELYLDNLRFVLDDVALLLANLNADQVVITADHGDAMGEFGAYGHPEGLPHPETRRVPWVETSASDEETYQPPPINDLGYGDRSPEVDDRQEPDPEVVDHLADLGYR